VGLAAARARGRTGGRKPKLNARQAATVRRMYAATGPDGRRQHTVAEIAELSACTAPPSTTTSRKRGAWIGGTSSMPYLANARITASAASGSDWRIEDGQGDAGGAVGRQALLAACHGSEQAEGVQQAVAQRGRSGALLHLVGLGAEAALAPHALEVGEEGVGA
jgi:hypothetical protein